MTLASSHGMHMDVEGNLFKTSSDFRSSHPRRAIPIYTTSHFIVRLPSSPHTSIIFYDRKLDMTLRKVVDFRLLGLSIGIKSHYTARYQNHERYSGGPFTAFKHSARWPSSNASPIASYFAVAVSVGVMYDWALAFGQEVELIWRQRWSLMTFLYLSVRYAGIGFAVVYLLGNFPTTLMKDAGCTIMYDVPDWMSEVVNVILGAIRIANVVIGAIFMMQISGEEFFLSGTYQCMFGYPGDALILASIIWILGTVWEVLALLLAVWIAVKHFRELRRCSTSDIIGDCFTVLMKTHVSYFASFLAISCFKFGLFSPMLSDMYSLDTQIYLGLAQISQLVQMFVLGPRLILGIREYHAMLVDNSDKVITMASIAFQEHVHVSTSSSFIVVPIYVDGSDDAVRMVNWISTSPGQSGPEREEKKIDIGAASRLVTDQLCDMHSRDHVKTRQCRVTTASR
ncbi:hypothetical protein BD769DRAFT_1384747 [Suillus cothurnatus]|nr:hypothetical protein BD769DRAFT_1384747 [Suillus cothurnatus]